MKAFARFKKEIWCMDLTYVDKPAKKRNGVKYILVRKDLFDKTVDAKRMKTKDYKETVRSVLTMITKKPSKKFGLTREQNLLDSLGNYAKLEEYNFTLQWVGPRLHLPNTIPEKFTLPLHGRQWIQVHSQIDSLRYNTKFLKKLLDRLDTTQCKGFRIFVHSVQQTTTRI